MHVHVHVHMHMHMHVHMHMRMTIGCLNARSDHRLGRIVCA